MHAGSPKSYVMPSHAGRCTAARLKLIAHYMAKGAVLKLEAAEHDAYVIWLILILICSAASRKCKRSCSWVCLQWWLQRIVIIACS